MGSVAVLSLAASGTSAEIAAGQGGFTTLLTPTGLGPGDIFVAIALVLVLGYLNVISAREGAHPRLRRTVISVSIPLLATFGVVVLYESIQIVT